MGDGTSKRRYLERRGWVPDGYGFDGPVDRWRDPLNPERTCKAVAARCKQRSRDAAALDRVLTRLKELMRDCGCQEGEFCESFGCGTLVEIERLAGGEGA